MKKMTTKLALVSLLTAVVTLGANAQQDSVKLKKVVVQFNIGNASRKATDSTAQIKANTARFVGGITFTRFDLGFSKLIDNGSFSLSPANAFLEYNAAKTSHVSFDVLQLGYKFNANFKVYIAGGFDWNLIRLRNDITFQKNKANLTYLNEPIQFDKNRLSSSYLHIPLNFELRSKENNKGKRFYFVFGPEIGFLLNGKVKQISKERGKEKFKDDYNFAPFRYGGAIRLGYGTTAIFAKYYASDMFDSATQKGLKNMAFGVTLGLN